MHDIGKLALPDGSLHRRRAVHDRRADAGAIALDDCGAELAHGVPYLRMTAPLVAATPTSGSVAAAIPRGLRGEAIPIGARIIAVADAFETRSPAIPDERDDRARGCANVELVRHAGSHFDPAVVSAWLRVSESVASSPGC